MTNYTSTFRFREPYVFKLTEVTISQLTSSLYTAFPFIKHGKIKATPFDQPEQVRTGLGVRPCPIALVVGQLGGEGPVNGVSGAPDGWVRTTSYHRAVCSAVSYRGLCCPFFQNLPQSTFTIPAFSKLTTKVSLPFPCRRPAPGGRR